MLAADAPAPASAAAPQRLAQPRRLGQYADVLRVLLAKDLKVRYRSTVLGYAWSVLHPLAFAIVFFIVFRHMIGAQVENYGLFLVAGLFPWQWISNSISSSPQCFLMNRSLLKKVQFPRWLLVASGVLNDGVHFVLTIPVLTALLLWNGKTPAAAWAYQIPLMLTATLLATLGISLLVATLNLFLRDLERFVALLLLLWFYVTPVLYPESMVLEWAHYANPMAALIICWRDVMLQGTLSAALFAAGLGWSVVFCGIGFAVYARLQWRFAELV